MADLVSRFYGMTHLPSGFNPKLTALISTYFEDNDPRWASEGSDVVRCLLEDAEFSLENQYSTPFENSNPEGRMPNLMGMLQSGQMTASMFDFMQASSNPTSFTGQVIDGAQQTLEAVGLSDTAQSVFKGMASTLEGLEGRTTFTKLNSQQIYTSSNSVKISGTLILSAWEDAHREVELALQKLQEMTVPRFLSDKSALMNGVTSGQGIQGFFPSEVPPFVSLKYGGKTYLPLVIESLSAPITAPMNANGDRITVKCQISFSSLKAWDKRDVINLYR